MANRFSLDAVIQPTIDDRAVDREVSEMQRSFEDGIGDVDVAGLGGAQATGAADGGGAGVGAAGGAGLLSGLGGTAAKAAVPVALAGGTAFGMLQGIQRLAEASPALKQTQTLFSEAMDLFLRPFGNALAEIFRPAGEALLSMSKGWNEFWSDPKGALGIGDILGTLGGGLAGAIGGAKGGAAAGASLGSIIPGAGTAAGGLAGAIGGAIVGALGGGTIGNMVGGKLQSLLGDAWPGWPDVSGLWPGWPNVGGLWPGWPSIDAEWPGWPDLSLPGDFWPTVEWPGWGEIMEIVQGDSQEDTGPTRGPSEDERDGVDFQPGSGGGRGPDFVGSGPERGRGAVGPNDPRLASTGPDELTAEELRRSRKANEQMVEELKALRRGRTSETVDPFMSR